jgi:branched-chain amino acid transport system substrate-binding protein
MRPLARRTLLAGAAGLAVAAPAGGARAQARGAPIHIGCITPLTGAQEVLGRPILTGAQIAAEQINAQGGVLGRPITIVPGDGAANPRVAEAAGRAMIADGVKLFCGGLRSEVAFALWPLMAPADAIMICCGAMSETLTHQAFSSHCFRICDHTYMRGRAQALLMAQRFPAVTQWAAIIPDIAYGHSAYAAFRNGLEHAYATLHNTQVQVGEPIVTRFGQTDFHAEAAALANGPPRGLFVGVYGDDAIAFYKAVARSGAASKMAVLTDSINEFIVPFELGSDVPDNLWLALHWYYGGYQQNPIARDLYEANLRHTGDPMPLGFLNEGHSAVHAFAAAIRASGDTDPAKLIAALSGLSLDTAKGRVTLRAQDHQAICDINFVRIRQMDGEPGFEVSEFVRVDGASVIEPPAPGVAITPL